MTTQAAIFLTQLVFGYVAWLLTLRAYVFPKLLAMDRIGALRAIAAFHSFRFFGLVFILPASSAHCPRPSPHLLRTEIS